MTRRIALLLLLLFLPFVSHAGKDLVGNATIGSLACPMMFGAYIDPTEAQVTDDFTGVLGSRDVSTTLAGTVDFLAPLDMTVHSLLVTIGYAAGAGDEWAVTVLESGSPSAVTCTISGASATTCNSGTLSESIDQGDTLSFFVDSSGGGGDPDANNFPDGWMSISLCGSPD